jgi:uncharacterized protein (TIGR02466 family)
MNIFPIFAVGLGETKVPEGLAPARKLFVENKKLLIPVEKNTGHTTTLTGYRRNNYAAAHKDTVSLRTVIELVRTHAIDFYTGCGYDFTNVDLEVSNIWLNEMKAKSVHQPHFHYGFQISGCFYVDVPNNSNNILFLNVDKHAPFNGSVSKTYTVFNSATWRMNPEEGDMYFWRSDLFHEVPTLDFVGVRRSIAFDISLIDKLPKKQTENSK